MEPTTGRKARRDRVRDTMLEGFPEGGRVAEIGVWEGFFSGRILEICAPDELHLIDPWLYQPEFPNTGFGRKKNENRMEEIYRGVVAKFADDDRVHIHRKTSAEGLTAMPDGFFDWVYIDGNHNAPYVGTDLALSLQKVRPDGIIAGDDYNWQTKDGEAPVRDAVAGFMAGLGDKAALNVTANQYVIRLNR